MEHLFFQIDKNNPSEFLTAYHSETLSIDWSLCDQGTLMRHVAPLTPWLGFKHDDVPLAQSLSQYSGFSGWKVEKIWIGELREAHEGFALSPAAAIAKHTASFLQAWLYYGLLESVLGKKIKISYMMRPNENDEELLYSRNLHFSLRQIVHKWRLADEATKRDMNSHITKELRLVQTWVSRLAAWSQESIRTRRDIQYPGFVDLVAQVLPAIVRLAESIIETAIYAFKGVVVENISGWQIPDSVAVARRRKMREAQWCDFQIRLLEETTNESTMEWCINQDIKQDPTGHDECTPLQCIRNNVPSETNPQRHRDPECQCSALMPDLLELERILLAGGIPLVSVASWDAKMELVVHAFSQADPHDYTAISHVWVDGMGGLPAQGLLECQVRWLDKIVTQLPQSTGGGNKFWIDTLCIPRKPKKVYYLALDRIRDVYIYASNTLVADRLIRTCPPEASTETLYAHIYMSAWMQRMWTYEEAVLSRNLIFVLKDDHFHPYSLKTHPSMMHTVSVVWRALAAELNRLRAKKSQFNIGHIYRAFRWRLTNAKQEEFLSVAGMLNLDTPSLMKAEGDERTRDFWKMLGNLPLDIPILNGPKLPIEGFKWAPSTMMYPNKTEISTDVSDHQAHCYEDGLRGTYMFILFSQVLNGSRDHTNSIFLIWVTGNEQNTLVSDDRMMLRVYCTESWPMSPDHMPFDSLIIGDPKRTIPSTGNWFPAAALLREPDSENTVASNGNFELKCAYVGRVLVERLQVGEILAPEPTVMFEGSGYAREDTTGQWMPKKLCIT